MSVFSILKEALLGRKPQGPEDPKEVALAAALTSGLFEVSEAMSTRVDDVQRSLDLIASATASILRVERCILMLKAPGEEMLVVRSMAGIPRGKSFDTYRQEIHDNIFSQIISSGQGMIVSESQVGSDRRLVRLMRRIGVKGFIAAPVRGPNGILGVLAAATPMDGRTPGDTDLKLLSVMANFAGVALENAKMVAKLDRKARKLAAIFAISKALNEEKEPSVLCQLIVDRATELMGASSGSMILVDRSTGVLRIEAEEGLGESIKAEMRLRIGEGITGYVAKEGVPVLVTDVRKDDRYIEANPNVRSEMAVPIKWGVEVVGVINLDHYAVEAFSEEDLELLIAFGNVAAVALRNADILGRQT